MDMPTIKTDKGTKKELEAVLNVRNEYFINSIEDFFANENFTFALVKCECTKYSELMPVFYIYKFNRIFNVWYDIRNGEEEKIRAIYAALIS